MSVIPPTNPLSYVGKEPVKRDYIFRTDPTTSDFSAFEIGDSWINIATGSFFVLTSKASGSATWTVGGGAGSGVITINTISPDGAGEFTLTAGTNITLTPGVNSITIASSDAGATSFPADAGTATEAAGVLNILGGTQLSTAGAGNTITINADAAVLANLDPDFGGPGIPQSNAFAFLGPGSSDFTSSGIATHVGATTEEMYFENRRFPSAFVVDANTTVGTRGEFSTLTAAAAAMSAGDTMYVRPGSYSENWTPAINTSVVGLSSVGQATDVTVAGTTNAPVGAGTTAFQNINFSTGGGVAVEAQGGAGSNLLFIDCNFSHTNHCIRFVSGNINCNRCDFASSAAETIVSESTGGGVGTFEDCNIGGTAGFATVQLSIASTLNFSNCVISGGDESFQATAGTANFEGTQCSPGFNIDACTVNFDHSSIDGLGATTGVSVEAGASFNGKFSEITSAGESAFEINAATSHTLYNMVIDAGSQWINIAAGSTLDMGNITILGDNNIGIGGTITQTPLTSSFHAFLPATVVGGTGAGAVFTLGTTTALTERFDSGGDFVPGTGVYTAPVTGTYEFTVRWVFGNLGATNDDLVCDIVATGVTYEIARLNIDAIVNPANQSAITGTALIQMTSGDTATFTATESGGGAASVDIEGAAAGDATYVMGRLINS